MMLLHNWFIPGVKASPDKKKCHDILSTWEIPPANSADPDQTADFLPLFQNILDKCPVKTGLILG